MLWRPPSTSATFHHCGSGVPSDICSGESNPDETKCYVRLLCCVAVFTWVGYPSSIGSRPLYASCVWPTKMHAANSIRRMQLEQLDLVMIHHRAPVNAFPRLVSPMKAFPNTPVPTPWDSQPAQFTSDRWRCEIQSCIVTTLL
jgi:hypothetical protein